MLVTNPYVQSELESIQNRNKFFDQLLIESKRYLSDITESKLEWLCIYPNKMLELNSSIDTFLWINQKSSEYYELFPLNDFDRTTIYQSFICIRNKWIRYNLAKWNNDIVTHFTIPDETIQFFSNFNTEEELIKNYYLIERFFDYTDDAFFEDAKQIKDNLLYSEWYLLYTNSNIYKLMLLKFNDGTNKE